LGEKVKINPFENHLDTPAIEKEKEKEKEPLTKGEIFLILEEEIKKAESRAASVWGLTREDIVEAIESIKEKIEEI